MAVALTHSKQT